eukprot:10494984-Heterocapsa_arctica.AAC.1
MQGAEVPPLYPPVHSRRERELPNRDLNPYDQDWQGDAVRRLNALRGRSSYPAAPAIPDNRNRRTHDSRGHDVSRSPHQM